MHIIIHVYILMGTGTHACHEAFLPLNWFTVADCGKLSVDGGQVSYTKAATDRKDTEFGAVAIYMCSSDFVLKGNSTRECLVNGPWSGSKPTCGMFIRVYSCKHNYGCEFQLAACTALTEQPHCLLFHRTHLPKCTQCSSKWKCVCQLNRSSTLYRNCSHVYLQHKPIFGRRKASIMSK